MHIKQEKQLMYKVKEHYGFVYFGMGEFRYKGGETFMATEKEVRGQEFKIDLVKEKKKTATKKKAVTKKKPLRRSENVFTQKGLM